MVFIMPGMENFAPERTLSSSGSAASPSFLPSDLLQFGEARGHLVLDLLRDGEVVLEEDVAHLRRDRESGGHGDAGPRHLSQACALAAENILHRSVTVGGSVAEPVNILLHARLLL